MAFIDELKKLLLGAGKSAVNFVNAPFDRIAADAQKIRASMPKNQSKAQTFVNALPQVARSVGNQLYKDVPIANTMMPYVGNRIVAPMAEIPKNVYEMKDIPSDIKNKKYLQAGMKAAMPVLNTSYSIANMINPIGTQAANQIFTGIDTVKGMLEAARKKQSLLKAGAQGFTGERVIGLGNAITDDPNLAEKINMGEQVAGLAIPAYHGIRGMLNKGKPIPPSEKAVAESSFELPATEKSTYIKPKITTKKGYIPPGEKTTGEKINYELNTDPFMIGKKGKKNIEAVQSEMAGKMNKLSGEPLTHKEVMSGVDATTPEIKAPVSRAQTKKAEQMYARTAQILADAATKDKVTPEFKDLFQKLKSTQTDVARRLEFMKEGVQPKGKGDPFMLQVFSQLKNELGDSFDTVWKAAQSVDFKNEEQVQQFYRSFVKPNAGDWVTKLRYSSMLSSPTTSLSNIESNASGTGLLAPIEKTVLGGIDWLSSKVTGKERQNFVGEGAEYAKGYWNLGNVKNAWNKFTTSMRTSTPAPGDVYTPKLTKAGTAGRKVENVFDFFPKFLKAQDEFFQALTEGGLKKSMAYKMKKGVTIENPESAAYLEARKRLFNAEFGLKEEGPVLKAIEYIPQRIMDARKSTNPIVSTIANLTFPFVRIPANILKQGIEYSPVGVTTMLGAGNKKEQLAKAIIGSTIFTMAATQASSDRLTWGEPTNQDQKKAFRAAGLQPYSIKIGDKWVSYSRLHPVIGMNFALAAAIKDSYDKGTIDQSDADKILGGAAKWLNYFADQSYIKNMGDLVAGAKGDPYGAVKFVTNIPLQMIPFRAFFSWINRATDPYYRDASGGGEGLVKQLDAVMKQSMAQLPGLSNNLPLSTDVMGNPIEKSPGSTAGLPNNIFNMVSPYVVKDETSQKPIYDNMMNRIQDEKNQKAQIKMIAQDKGVQPKTVSSMLKKSNGQPTNDYLLNLLAQKQAEADKIKTVTDILTRSGSYKDVPQGQTYTQRLMQVNGITQDDVKTAKNSMIAKLNTKETVNYIKNTPNVNLTDLFSQGALTTAVAREMERQGYIQNADALMKKMKATDIYYERAALRKATTSFSKKMASLQKKTMSSILKRRAKTYKIAKIKMPKMKKVKKVSYKLPKLKLK